VPAELIHATRKRVVRDDSFLPDLVEKILARDDLAGPSRERHQDLHNFRIKLCPPGRTVHFASERVDGEFSEPENATEGRV
jgi:hypothetical protein